jgi:2-keto-4-pentenoate hydratase
MTYIPLVPAQILADQRLWLSPTFLDPDLRPCTELEGYNLQRQVNSLLAARLGNTAGLKIGCTTPVMQKFLGIPALVLARSSLPA